ncbi:MAG: DUF1631 family protein, partial [Gammaproteobacteria bacterium]
MSTGHGSTGGIEQRRFARVPINLEGYLGVGERPPVPCTVRDFCLGGMFISADPAAYADAPPASPALLYFALVIDGEKRDFQLPLAVARVVAKGIGVTFAAPDDAAVALLARLAAPAGLPEPDHGDGSAELAATADFDAAYATVCAPLQALVAEHLGALLERFIERVDEVLFQRARDAGNNVAETRFLDGQRELRGRRDSLAADVPPRIAEAVRIIGNPLASAQKEPDAIGLSDLSLVEKDEFEEFLVVSAMVSELEPEFTQQLWQLSRRFSHLANRVVSDSSNPLGPGVLCNAMAESLKGLQSDRSVTTVVYEVLHGVMSQHLGRLYDDANELLVSHGVLPVIERDKPALKRRPAPSTTFDAAVPDAPADEPVADEDFSALMPGPDGYHGRPPASMPAAVQPARPAPPAGAQLASGATGGIAAAMPSLPPGLAVAPAPATPPPGAAGALPDQPGVTPASLGAAAPGAAVQAAAPSLPAYFDGAVQAASPGAVPGWAPDGGAPGGAGGTPFGGWTVGPLRYTAPPVQRAYSAAQTQLALRRQLGGAASAPAGEDAVSVGYETAQIVEGLGALQEDYAEGPAEPLDVAALKDRIVAALTAAGAPPRAIGGNAADALEVVANLFGALLEDALIATGAKEHLTRLQPSVHRAALLDEQFFQSPDHPVRLLIDRLARLRDGKTEPGQRRQARVRELVGRANREFRDDIGVFAPVLDEVETLLAEQEDEYRERVSAVVTSCEEQQRVLEARRGTS